MNIISTIVIIGIVNGILEGIALLVFVRRGNWRANRILGFLVIILAFCVFGMSLGAYTEHHTTGIRCITSRKRIISGVSFR
jgi:hypothetical protein